MTITRCQHIKTNGVQCGSPALRGALRCFFHQQLHRSITRKPDKTLDFPVLEDGHSIQFALMLVMKAIANGQLNTKQSAHLLWALQIAAHNVKQAQFDFRHRNMVRDLADLQAEYTPPPTADETIRGLGEWMRELKGQASPQPPPFKLDPLPQRRPERPDRGLKLFEEVYSDYRSQIAPDLERLASLPAEGGRATPASAPAAPGMLVADR